MSYIPEFKGITISGVDEFAGEREGEDKRDLLLPIVIEVVEAYFSDDPKSFFLSGCVGCRKTGTMEIIRTYLRYGLTLWNKRIQRPTINRAKPLETQEFDWQADDINRRFDRMVYCRNDIKRIKHKSLEKQLKKREFGEWFPDSVLNTNTLFLEDFGTDFDDQKGFNLSLQQLFFDDRSEACSPNFITSNMSEDELRTMPGWSRIVDRILNEHRTITFNYGDDAKSRR